MEQLPSKPPILKLWRIAFRRIRLASYELGSVAPVILDSAALHRGYLAFDNSRFYAIPVTMP
jgi:hypothetical protein